MLGYSRNGSEPFFTGTQEPWDPLDEDGEEEEFEDTVRSGDLELVRTTT